MSRDVNLRAENSASEASSIGTRCVVADDAGDWLGLALLLGQQFQRAIAAPASRHLKHAGLVALAIQHWRDFEALEKAAPLRQRPGDVVRVNGCLFHTDGVHLNTRAGLIVAIACRSSLTPEPVRPCPIVQLSELSYRAACRHFLRFGPTDLA